MSALIGFAGGGSGGHLSPGLAIAERLAELDPSVRAVFYCSQRPVDASMLVEAGAQYEPIPASGLSLRPAALARFLIDHRRGRGVAMRLMQDRRPDRVVALGGFVAAPIVSAARRIGVPVTLMNLDRRPGKANQWMARRCAAGRDEVLSAVETPGRPEFAREVTGMPVRRGAMATDDPATCRAALGLAAERRTMLVTGASQGAGSINALMMALAERDPQQFDGWQVYHLAGEGAVERVSAAYEKAGIAARVAAFEHAMGRAWGAADLAISRAGASSVAEAAANAVPTVFLPYPYHRDAHQRANAEPMESIGGAVVLDDAVDPAANVASAGAVVLDLMGDPGRIDRMREALVSHRPADAAMAVARRLLEQVGR